MFSLMALAVAYKANNVTNQNNDEYSVASLSNFVSGGSKNAVSKKEYLHFVAITPLLGVACVALFFLYKMALGEYYMRTALNYARQNNGSKTFEYQLRAINANPAIDTYQNAFAQTNLSLANVIASNQNLTDEDKKRIQALVSQAIKSSRFSTEQLNPLNVAGWEVRGSIYTAISGIAQDADKWAIASYNQAIQLDPTNPILRLQLGGLYYAQKDYLAAANQFRSSVTLKPDYANAHYNFALALKELKDYANAVRVLEAAQKLVAANPEDLAKLTAEIATIKAMPEYAASQAAVKPTVEDLANTAEKQSATTSQEKLTPPSQLNQINTQPQQ
jgi:tetratricopeptide (TPR) repeat protein